MNTPKDDAAARSAACSEAFCCHMCGNEYSAHDNPEICRRISAAYSISGAWEQFQRAGRELAAATARVYPVGAVVAVRLGKSRVVGTIEWSGRPGTYQPYAVALRNEKTGKLRRFSAVMNHVEILSLPNAEAVPQGE